MRKSVRERLAEAKRRKDGPQVMSFEDLMLLLLDPRPRPNRRANPTQLAFILDNSPFSAFMGPKGSAKTSAGAAAGWLRMLLQPGSKGLVTRKDYNDLKQTTRLRFEEMLQRLPAGTLLDRSKEPPETWYINTVPMLSPEGDVLDDTPAQVSFAGLESLGEAGSYEFDWAFIDEASEVEERSVHAVNGLMRNIPRWAESMGELRGFYRTMMAFNPTDTFHWLYTACTGFNYQGHKVKEPWVKLFTPQLKENQRNLPRDYYERLAETMPADMRVRLVEGQWGAVFEGAPVLKEFSTSLHVIKNLMQQFDVHAPLYRFWDFGYRHPCVIWAQIDEMGRLLHFKELMVENVEIAAFVDMVRTREAQWFPGHEKFLDYGDPAARQKKDTGSTLAVLAQKGIVLRYQISTIEAGLSTMRVWMERLIGGAPAVQYDADGCPILIRGLAGGYHMDDKGEKPLKDGYYDHLVDANRYGYVNLFGVTGYRPTANAPKSLEYNPAYDSQLMRGM